MLIAIVIASLVSYLIARSISDPIVRMRREAGKLAKADYTANFEGGRYSETAELASTLNDARDKLSKIDQLRRDLIANVSHDIRTPITDIRAYAEMIRDISGDDPVKRQKHLDVIIRETQYMNNLVTDMSELSKMQSGNYHLNIEEVDLASVIRDIIGIYSQTMKKGDIHMQEEFADDLIVYADEIKISQVISNYVSNAVKHSPDGGTITVRAYMKEDEKTVRLEVQDEGDGISPEDMPYIWDRYHKFSRNFREWNNNIC
jgi:signal transduction histidine kinase